MREEDLEDPKLDDVAIIEVLWIWRIEYCRLI